MPSKIYGQDDGQTAAANKLASTPVGQLHSHLNSRRCGWQRHWQRRLEPPVDSLPKTNRDERTDDVRCLHAPTLESSVLGAKAAELLIIM